MAQPEPTRSAASIVADEIERMGVPTCHVYIVSRTILHVDEPKGVCLVCDAPLAHHAKQTSSYIPVGKAFVIDEKELKLP